MKKVGIITLHRVFNYGSILQAYATQKLFEKENYDVEIIDYITPERTIKKIIGKPNYEEGRNIFLSLSYYFLRIGSIFLKICIFGKFLKKNINLTKKRYISFYDLMQEKFNYDIYVTGSDQVWNSQYNEGIDRGFFLDFVNKKIKIAFSSSFGSDKLKEKEEIKIKKLLEKYDKISVREESALKVLKKLNQKGDKIIDPTLQIDHIEWKKLASKKLIQEKYLLLFLLYNEDDGATAYAKKIADQKKLKLVKLSWQFFKPPEIDKLMTHRSPNDFLSLVSNADFIVTNSFHGICFSVNFNKEFVAIPRKNFNTRLESILELLNLENRFVRDIENFEIINEKINYFKVNKILKIEREKAKQFIKI